LIIAEERKKSIHEFVTTNLIIGEKPAGHPIFCGLLGSFPNVYDNPWSSPTQRQDVIDYLQYITPKSKQFFSKIVELCNHQAFSCKDADKCLLTIMHYPYMSTSVVGQYNGWKISFVSNNEVTLTPQFGKDKKSESFIINKVGNKHYTFKSKKTGNYLEANKTTGALRNNNSDLGEQGRFEIFSLEKCSPWRGKHFIKSKPMDEIPEMETWKKCGLACNQYEDSKCVAWSFHTADGNCTLYDGIKHDDEKRTVDIWSNVNTPIKHCPRYKRKNKVIMGRCITKDDWEWKKLTKQIGVNQWVVPMSEKDAKEDSNYVSGNWRCYDSDDPEPTDTTDKKPVKKEKSKLQEEYEKKIADAKANNLCPEKNTDYYGNDILEYDPLTYDSWLECALNCKETAGCKFWSWVDPKENYNNLGRRCFFKWKKGTSKTVTGIYSGDTKMTVDCEATFSDGVAP